VELNLALNEEKAQLIEDILELEHKVYQALRPIVSKEWLSVDLTMPQLKVLLFLFTDGPARMGVLASALSVSMTTTTGIVDRLVQRGQIVRRNYDEDRRTVVCNLSEKGRELIASLWEMRKARERSLFRRMTLPKLRLVSEGLGAILDTVRKMDDERF